MGRAKAEMMRLHDMRGPATAAALKAGAVRACELHDDMILEVGDSEAEKLIYAIGNNMVKNGDVDGTREEFMVTVKAVLEEAMDECPLCARNWNRD